MQTQRLKSQMPTLALAALALVALAAVACNGNGDDSSPADGSPSTTVTPGSGDSPAVAVGTYIDANGLDGHKLDLSRQAECPLEPVQTVIAGTPTILSRLFMGQFCLASKDWEPDKAITIIVDLPDTGERWEMKLEFDSEVSLWNLLDVKKVSE